MRIIAGQWRGRQIEGPEGDETRPILDRAKTVLFDVLGNRLAEPGRLPPIAVLDLFAGTGTLGLEAMSRGARYCLFVERHRPTAARLRHNLDTLGVLNEAKVVEADAGRIDFPPPPPPQAEILDANGASEAGIPKISNFQSDISNLKSEISNSESSDWPQASSLKPLASAYELIFFDPPYRLLERPAPDRSIRTLLSRLATHRAIATDALIVVRHKLIPPGGEPDLSPLVERERRDVGTMTFRFMAPPSGNSKTEPGN